MANILQWRPSKSGIIFVIVAILLAAGVFAGAWFLQQRGEQARQQQAADTAQQNLEQESDTPVIIAEETPAQEDEGRPEEQPRDQSDSQPEPAPQQLPATGTDEVVIILGVTGLALATAFYVASRRAVREL